MTVSLFKIGGIWHYRFQVAPNPRVQRSTKLRSKAAALQVADRAYSNAVERANGGEPMPTLSEVIVEWFELRAPISSAAHIRSVDVFKRLHTYDLGGRLISDIDTEAVERARAQHLATHNFASANHWLRVLKLLVNWAVKRRILARLPWDVAMLKVQKRPRAILPMSVVMNWFEQVDRASSRAAGVGIAVRLMLWLGLRESEAITARWEWFDWERRTYTPGITKGREADALRLPRRLAEYLEPMHQIDGLVACQPDGQAFGPGFCRLAIMAANAACAIKGITPHRLRGTIATMMSEEGVPVQDVQRYLRHKDVRTTMAYLEINMDRVTQAQDRITGKIENHGEKMAK
ncbi:tyrosine-type recombinase/integrase [Duganella sp. CY15W]|uniref:tyrosine-type recombinase/integrase n=1 Tax=Duganella sp. CY15W TaxID=2692172 RepID=UPI0013718114|nr:site-specific integrase [Duganella sp. CY15W]MYM31500.1 tyrosine-type recombinase/integrase [Duganella sp. CY15W]